MRVFSERERSSDFMTAITDHRQYLQRKARAEEMRQSYAQAEHGSKKDFSLKPGEKITLRLPMNSTSGTSSSHIKSQAAPQSQDADEDEWGDFVGTQ